MGPSDTLGAWSSRHNIRTQMTSFVLTFPTVLVLIKEAGEKIRTIHTHIHNYGQLRVFYNHGRFRAVKWEVMAKLHLQYFHDYHGTFPCLELHV